MYIYALFIHKEERFNMEERQRMGHGLDTIGYKMLSDYLGYEVSVRNISSAYRELISRGIEMRITHHVPTIVNDRKDICKCYATVTTTIKFVAIDMGFAENVTNAGKRTRDCIIDDVMGDM